LFDFLATTGDGDARIEVRSGRAVDSPPLDDRPSAGPVAAVAGGLRVEVGGTTLVTARSAAGPVAEVLLRGALGDGRPFHPRFEAKALESGPVRTRIGFTSADLPDGLTAFGHIDFFPSTPVVRVQLTLRNTRAAGHPGGNWDLGGAGSTDLRDLTVAARFLTASGPAVVSCSAERGQPARAYPAGIELYQDSSGGENWKHHTHLNRDRVVPHRFRGYQVTADGTTVAGLRATPVVTVARGGRTLGVTMPYFWENFPKAVAADSDGWALGLFPRQSTAPYELQGGEQKTHVFYVALDRDEVTDDPLAWARTPTLAHADPEWYAAAEAVPYLTPAAADQNTAYKRLVDQAIEGPDTFFAKREVIDEYGWRNFGDVYADHEAVRHDGPEALVSHYNNQFDVVRGCAVQFLRSSDPRWWDLLVPAADHTCDVDIYHTTGDKAAYNGGLFWCTAHYSDADTGTHRTYPRSLRRSNDPGLDGASGGPSASHVYAQGLMLAHFLTGNPLYREAATGLAWFVHRLDKPQARFRLLANIPSGLLTESRAGYHGPGRATANAILALVVGHRLTGDRRLLDKAEELIRRVAHPWQDLDALDLLNAEHRWFYTMHLQAVGEYLDHKAELGETDRGYAHARQTLLHYAAWMAANERLVLDRPAAVQFPTETWAAQDMRKVEVFQYAVKHTTGRDRAALLERAEWFFAHVVRTLGEFRTRSLCRPVVLMLNFGWSRTWWQANPGEAAPPPAVSVTRAEVPDDWSLPTSQKAIAIRRAKRLAVVTGLAAAAAVVGIITR
jgi:hypothetical protein